MTAKEVATGSRADPQGPDRCTAVGQPVDRRLGGADPEVVGDRVPVEGHVEVGAHEDALAGEAIELLLEILQRRDAVDHCQQRFPATHAACRRSLASARSLA